MIFWGENLVFRFSGQKGPNCAQGEVFQVLSKVNAKWNFSIFVLHEVRAAKRLKLIKMFLFFKGN